MDVKTSSNAIGRMSMPTCIMQLQVSATGYLFHDKLSKNVLRTYRIVFLFPIVFKVQENAREQNAMPAVRRLNVELTKEKLDTMLDGLGKIRDQLSSVAK